ncbi:hypothetical protein HYFRA_00007186 [Hymenoscyphus fraxineus]|uniref:Heterokaryon incompatibility domain-containing protein n=1 Tax=Hymenoscyphus fraxineus TaxID=746836 RepID=A0A9N9KZW7_9HELO|nr:hypothetical protein HYFRA_00007186 [Hymenoscyphus fraxineus]
MTGRQLGPKMDFSLAKSWLNECAEKHESCSAAINTPLPSRILDLAAPGETRHVRLKVDNAGVFERYATLSHCWGESQPLKLTQSTYEGFRKEISFESLPRTFQDAVTAARSLGLKYLWIDSLCIVQDSKEDWEEQCTAMRQIYKYSFVTLAAPEASDCNAGFLHSRPPPLKVDFQLSDGASVVLSHHGCADYPYDKQSNREDYRLINKRDYRSLTEQNSPLFKRAWILQERLLSSRVLYLSPSRIYLECFTNNRYEDCHYPTPGPDKLLSKNVTKWKSEQLGDERQRFAHWEHLVVRYSNMNLTYGTDRLPALSGLVSEFHRVTKATYLAGHWLEDLNLGWFVVSQGQSKAALSGSEYVAPSWSWASSNGPIEFYRPWDFPKDMVFYHGLEINQAVCSTGIDPFGIVKSGYLDITGILKKGVSARRSPDRRYFQVITSCYTMERMGCSRGESFGMYYPDNPSTVLEPESKLLLLFLGRFQYTRFVLCDRVIAIAVEPIDGEEEYTYRRIGLVITRGFRVEQGFHEHFFADIKPTILRLI